MPQIDSSSVPAPAAKQLAVFVHGFGSSPACWEPFLKLLRQDPAMAASFDFMCYQYETRWFNFSPLQRIPRLKEVATGLAQFLDASRFDAYTSVTLVGHSQGGLVIQTYLAEKLLAERGAELARIRQVIMFSTPNLGSTLLQPARNVLFRVFENPQERALRVLNPEIHDLMQDITDRVLNAKAREKTHWPIPVRVFWGLKDGLVPEASARGPFEEGAALPGSHFSILQPPNPDDERYRALADALRVPLGHPNFFEVDRYDMTIAVEPLPDNHEETVKYGPNLEKTRIVKCDNFARILRRAAFARRNRCSDIFEIRYRTQNDGFIRVSVSGADNQASPAEMGDYEEYGHQFSFKFNPEPGKTYEALFEVYKGFDQGNRDLHFHLGKQTHYRGYSVKLDLTRYLAAGYKITMTPSLWFAPQDPGHKEICGNRKLHSPLSCARSDPAGIWEWEVVEIREGIIDVAWDLARPASVSGISAGQGA